MDVTKPYIFIGFGAMDVTKPYKFIGCEAMDATKPYKLIGFGAMDATKPYKFIGFGAMDASCRPGRPILRPFRGAKQKPGGFVGGLGHRGSALSLYKTYRALVGPL